jgi:carbon storage regulator CsrA
MLVLSRKRGEAIVIGEGITVTVLAVDVIDLDRKAEPDTSSAADKPKQ